MGSELGEVQVATAQGQEVAEATAQASVPSLRQSPHKLTAPHLQEAENRTEKS